MEAPARKDDISIFYRNNGTMDIKETLAGHHRTVIETKEEDIS
jgi:hypothetical protein